jgi:hypothetical protein
LSQSMGTRSATPAAEGKSFRPIGRGNLQKGQLH